MTSTKLRKGLFPGSFDPFTKGHEVIVHKALTIFDELVIAVGFNSTKESYFSLEKRKEHIASLFNNHALTIVTFQKLTVDLCADLGATHLVRGLRDSKDFTYEQSIAHMNHTLSGIDTVFLLTDPIYLAVNSSIVREIHANGGDISHFVTNAHLLV